MGLQLKERLWILTSCGTWLIDRKQGPDKNAVSLKQRKGTQKRLQDGKSTWRCGKR